MKRTISKLILVCCIVWAITAGAFAAEPADVTMTADVTQNNGYMSGTVYVQFADQSLYNDQVKLSWHIYDAEGNLLQFENERYPLVLADGQASVQLMDYLPALGSDEIVVRFDLVDEQNIFWFSDNPEVTLRQAEFTVQAEADARPVRIELTADFPGEIKQNRLEGNVTVFFGDASYYHEQVKLSWHIYDADGGLLAYENARIALPPLENGQCVVPVSIDLNHSAALSGAKDYTVRFDLVDERNAFWFSEREQFDFRTAEAVYHYRFLSEVADTFSGAAKNQMPLLFLNVVMAVCAVVVAVVLWRKKARRLGPKKGVTASEEAVRQQTSPAAAFPSEVRGSVSDAVSRRNIYLVVLLFFAFCGALFWIYKDYYFNDMFPMSGDGLQWINGQTFVKRSLEKVGEFPLWNRWLAGGVPYVTELSPMLILSVLPAKEFIYTCYIGVAALGALCLFLYLKEIRCSSLPALTISVCYLFSIHLGGARKSHPGFVLAVALFPCILFLVERYFTTRRLRWLLASSGMMALQFLCGSLQHAVYTDLFLGVYLIAFGLHYKMKISTMLKHGLAWAGTYLGLVFWKLVPMLEQNYAYADAGSARIAYEIFVSYSIHPIKFIEMLFPQFFNGEIYQAFGAYYSSEFDIEIFLGYVIAVLAVAGAVLLFRDFRIRFYLASMVGVVAYSSLGTFPALAKLIYRIPYLGDFRCSARALYIFIFLMFTLAALGLTELLRENNAKKLAKLSLGMSGTIIGFVAAAIFAVIIVIGITLGFFEENFYPLAHYISVYLKKDLYVIFVTPLFIWFVCWLLRHYPMWRSLGVCSVVTALTLVQTLPYTSFTSPSYVSEISAVDDISAQLVDEVGNWKIWDAFQSIDGQHSSIISHNRGMSKGIASINSYMTFNNPYLYRLFSQEKQAPMNYSGLLTGSLKAPHNVSLQNSLLSMLGVRYLIDSSEIIEKNSSYFQLSRNGEIQYSAESITIPDSGGDVFVYQEPFRPEAGTWYQISFSCDTLPEQTFYFDLYGGEEYDGFEQQTSFSTKTGSGGYSGLVYSGDSDAFTDIVWRLVSWGTEEFELHDFTITRLDSMYSGSYVPWDPELAPDIYVNENARDVLYVPDSIEQIDDREILYQDTVFYSLDRVNYMEEFEDRFLNPETAVISDIDFTSNQIHAQIEAEEDTFVNFSQCYYPGWKAYVDGGETELYMVNGLIMGMEVPAGTHDIAFVYRPMSFYVGSAISGTLAAALIVGLVIIKRRETQQYARGKHANLQTDGYTA